MATKLPFSPGPSHAFLPSPGSASSWGSHPPTRILPPTMYKCSTSRSSSYLRAQHAHTQWHPLAKPKIFFLWMPENDLWCLLLSFKMYELLSYQRVIFLFSTCLVTGTQLHRLIEFTSPWSLGAGVLPVWGVAVVTSPITLGAMARLSIMVSVLTGFMSTWHRLELSDRREAQLGEKTPS